MSIGREPAIWAIACIAGTLLAASPAAAQCQYDVTVIRAPEVCGILGPVITGGIGLNGNGAVVGYWSCPASGHDKAFVWTPETGLISLEMPAGVVDARAFDIDNAGDIVGVMGGVVMPRRGFLRRGNAVVDLGTLPGGNWSEAYAISAAGVVGFWGDPSPIAFIWRDGIMIDLGPDFGTPNSRANDITGGLVTGWMASSRYGDARAFIWEEGVVVELPPIPGGFTSEGRAINEGGDVAGLGYINDPGWPIIVRHAFLWVDGQIMDLGTLPDQHRSVANDVNKLGQVVGYCDNYPESGAYTGFIWQNGQMTALSDLIPAKLNLHISVARAINGGGQITGQASTASGVVAVLLTPVEGPPGDLDGDCRVRVPDLLTLLAAWGRCSPKLDCPADLNDDGTVNQLDLVLLIVNWG